MATWAVLEVWAARARLRRGSGDGRGRRPRDDHAAAGYVEPLSALAIGALGAVASFAGVRLMGRTEVDDSLDVFACHGSAAPSARCSRASSRRRPRTPRARTVSSTGTRRSSASRRSPSSAAIGLSVVATAAILGGRARGPRAPRGRRARARGPRTRGARGDRLLPPPGGGPARAPRPRPARRAVGSRAREDRMQRFAPPGSRRSRSRRSRSRRARSRRTRPKTWTYESKLHGYALSLPESYKLGRRTRRRRSSGRASSRASPSSHRRRRTASPRT